MTKSIEAAPPRPVGKARRRALRMIVARLNYIGTHYGGSLYSMTDPFIMLMLIENLRARLRGLGQMREHSV
jgi:hypothetical protein